MSRALELIAHPAYIAENFFVGEIFIGATTSTPLVRLPVNPPVKLQPRSLVKLGRYELSALCVASWQDKEA